MEIVIPSVVIVVPSAANMGLFIGAALALLLIPGPAVLYIVARSAEQGRLAGFVSDLGIHTATLVQVLAAAVGLSALLASSALAFAGVKYAGAAYLIWLGLKKIFGRDEADGVEGKFKARLTIDADGQVESVTVLSGVDPAFDAAIIAALKHWRFKPAMACGKPVAGATVPFNARFELGD